MTGLLLASVVVARERIAPANFLPVPIFCRLHRLIRIIDERVSKIERGAVAVDKQDR